jgi:hypothetical protein
MKILDIPQSGKRGLNVSQNSRYGQISRALVIPTNPRSPGQMNVRSTLSGQARRWDTLTQAQRDAWNVAACGQHTQSRLGQSGPLTGLQFFVKINATLIRFGQEAVDAPAATPQFPDLAPASLVITNTAGAIALKLTCPTDPGNNTIVRASAPVRQGAGTCNDYRIVGTVPAPALGSSDITALYTAKYGVPPVGTKVFVQCNQYVDGFQSIPVTYWAIVPPQG